jgi:hypothetical protein
MGVVCVLVGAALLLWGPPGPSQPLGFFLIVGGLIGHAAARV